MLAVISALLLVPAGESYYSAHYAAVTGDVLC
jgi:hypothetical protein